MTPNVTISFRAPQPGEDVGGFRANQFMKAWDAALTGITVVQGVGGKEKLAKMQWCLYEGLRRADAEFLRAAVVITLSRDVRHGRLLVRFRAVRCSGVGGNTIETRTGVLGHMKNFGTGAVKIAAATKEIMKHALQPSEPPDHCGARSNEAVVFDI